MTELLSQLVLPITLATIMLAMGFSLTVTDFKRVFHHPRATFIGLALQLLLLPCSAILLAYVLNLPPLASAGLFLVSLCPGGATSNLFSYLAKGDVALSITLTAITSVIIPISLPIAFVTYMNFIGETQSSFSMPIGLMIKKLALVTLLPVLVGMMIRHFFTQQIQAIEKKVRILAASAMIVVVILLMIANSDVIKQMATYSGLSAILLCVITLITAYFVSHKLLKNKAQVHTITIEVGVQNAGTAMMVALTLLNQPVLAVIPLMYGLLMNIPAFTFVWWAQRN